MVGGCFGPTDISVKLKSFPVLALFLFLGRGVRAQVVQITSPLPLPVNVSSYPASGLPVNNTSVNVATVTVSGTVTTSQGPPVGVSTVTFNGVSQPVNNTSVNVATVTISGTPTVTANQGTTPWNVGVPTVTFNGVGQPVTGTFWQTTQPVSQSGSYTVTPGTGAFTITPTTFNVVQGGSYTVTPGTGTWPATQSGSWTDTVIPQNGSFFRIGFSTTTTTAVLPSTFTSTSIAISTPIAGVGGQTIRVFRLILVVDSATTINFRDGNTPFGDPYYLTPNGSITLDLSNEPWYITSSSNGFQINQTGTANIGARIWYTQS